MVMLVEGDEKKGKADSEKTQKMFMNKLDIDAEIAAIFVREGFGSLEEIAYIPAEELANVEEFDEEIVAALQERAKEVLAKQEAAPQPDETLLQMRGMDRELAGKLAAKKVKSMEDLAELGIEELIDIVGDMPKERAAELIMTAREPWFE